MTFAVTPFLHYGKIKQFLIYDKTLPFGIFYWNSLGLYFYYSETEDVFLFRIELLLGENAVVQKLFQ